MKIVHQPERLGFYAYSEDGRRIGEIEYEFDKNDDKRVHATHTYVDPEFEGQGIGGKLLKELVSWAEREGCTVVPVCSFVKAAFGKDPEKYRKVMVMPG
jgi:Predicted acetyltransferase